MRRREFIAALGGAVAAVPLVARAQQSNQVRRVGVLQAGLVYDARTRAQLAGARDVLKSLGWIEGRNLQIDVRYAGGDPRAIDAYAEELVSLGPDVIVATTGVVTIALQKRTKTIPIIFTGVGDPVQLGVVKSLARPEGNITGITNLYSSIGGKWLELLKEIVPNIKHAAILLNPNSVGGYVASFEAAAAVLGVTTTTIHFADANELERAIEAFAAKTNGSLSIQPPALVGDDRQRVVQLAAEYRLPTIYPDRTYVLEGGLMSYGSDLVTRTRQAALYVDRILRGAKPGDLPIQFPNKFDLVINLKTAKALGLTVPPTLLATVDEVIE